MTTRLVAARDGRARHALLIRASAVDATTIGGALAALIGFLVLIGWGLGLEGLKSTLPGLVTMKVNTAVCLVLLGIAVIAKARELVAARGVRPWLVLVVAVIVVAGATGLQYAIGADFGIDQLLVREPIGALGTVMPGRMSTLTVGCLVMLAVAVLVGPRATRLVIVLASITLAVAALNVFDFVFDAGVPSFLDGSTQMALSTAIAMGALALGAVALLGPANPLAALAGPSPTARLLRRLLAVTLAIPVLMAWLRLEGEQLGLYDTSYGTSLMLLGTLVFGTIAILGSARWANAQDAKRLMVEIERDRFFELSLDMLSVIGDDGRFRRVNHAWQTSLGYPDGFLVGRSFMDFLHPDDVERTASEAARQYGEAEASIGFLNRYRHFDGTYRWLEWMSNTSPDGTMAYGVARDVTERRRGEDRRARQKRVLETRNEALSEQAIHDRLTGLHNRGYFDSAVARLERRWRRTPVDEREPVSVILFDLDHFGNVNKDHGHQAGDIVLQRFAQLLRKRFREDDLVARYGGEEFVAILEAATTAQACAIAEGIRAGLDGLSIDIGTGSPIHVTVSAGISELGDDRIVSSALSRADVWLSQAKRSGRNHVVGL